MRFVRLDSEHAQSDGKSVIADFHCWTWPEAHSGQTTWHARDLSTSGHFPVLSHKISTVNLRHSSHLGTKSNHSVSTNALLPSFTAQATGFFIWKSDPREADDNNYRDYNTSLHVSLRTRKFDKKIHYCCRDSFFVEEDI